MSRVRITLATAAILLLVGAAGCGKKPPAAAPPPPPPPTTPAPPPPPPPPPPAPAPAPRPLTEEEIFAKKTLEELNAERPLADVFFGFDSSELTDVGRADAAEEPRVSASAGPAPRSASRDTATVAARRSTTSPSANGAPRRSRAIWGAWASAPTRVMVVSKGKETPFCNEESEACWSQNRRGHFMFTAK